MLYSSQFCTRRFFCTHFLSRGSIDGLQMANVSSDSKKEKKKKEKKKLIQIPSLWPSGYGRAQYSVEIAEFMMFVVSYWVGHNDDYDG